MAATDKLEFASDIDLLMVNKVTDEQIRRAKELTPPDLHEALGFADYIGHDRPKNAKRLRPVIRRAQFGETS